MVQLYVVESCHEWGFQTVHFNSEMCKSTRGWSRERLCGPQRSGVLHSDGHPALLTCFHTGEHSYAEETRQRILHYIAFKGLAELGSLFGSRFGDILA